MRGPLSTSNSNVEESDTTPANGAEKRRFPLSAFLAFILIVTFEVGFVYHYRYRFWDSTYSLAEIKRNLLTSKAPADDVAIFGNSRFYHVDPNRLKEVYGPAARITNYAWAWCGMDIYEPMLRSLIDAGRIPKILIVDGNPEVFGYRPELLSLDKDLSNLSRYSQTAPLWPGLRNELAQHLWGPAWQTLATYLTPPSIMYGERVGKGLERLLKRRKSPKQRQDFNRIVGEWKRKGWLQFAPEHVSDEAEYKLVEGLNGPYKLFLNEETLQSYERFLKLAQDHDVQVIMLPIVHNSLQYAAYKRNFVYAAYDLWLDEMQKRYPVFSAPAPRYLDWPGTLGDAGHLNSTGIKRHMEFLVDRLLNYEQNAEQK